MRMLRAWPLWMWMLACLAACGDDPAGASPPGQIQYEFVAQNAPEGSRLADRLSDLLGRIGPQARLHAAFTHCKDSAFADILLEGLRQAPGSRLILLTHPDDWDHSQAPGQVYVRDRIRDWGRQTGQIWVENDRNPRAGRLGPHIADPSLQQQNNFLLIDSVQGPNGSPLKSVVILFSKGPEPGWDAPGNHFWAIYGDPGLYQGFLQYWNEMAESRIDFAFHAEQTFSNLHDHRAWFFPSFEGTDPSADLLSALDSGITATGQPAKVYLALPRLDDPERIMQLRRLYELQGADVRLILGDSLPGWAEAQVRVRPDLPSSIWLVQGPINLEAPGEPERSSWVGMGSHTWSRTELDRHSASAIAVKSKTLFEKVEPHWLGWWKGW